MGVPISQMWTVATYVLSQKLRGIKRYPLVLMLEPLFRCNLTCAGCGKIQHPSETLRRNLTPEQCFTAAEECGAPMVSIPGGEPLLHPQIDQIVAGLVARKKYVYLCTNALRLEESLGQFTPTKFLTFSVHLDGPRREHDRAVGRDGVYDTAIRAIRAAISRGFRVTTNTTLFLGVDAERIRRFFDEMLELGIEGMMVSPGYSYRKAPDQEHFLGRRQTVEMFRRILQGKPRRWKFNHTPLFLEFLQGNWGFECTPWGNPTYNLFGWQKPCYLLDDGYCESFEQLMTTTNWDRYGHTRGDSRCRDCMVHCGYEPSAVIATFGSLRGMMATLRLTFGGGSGWAAPENFVGAGAGSPGQYVELPVLQD
jgi:hopanoid biosynthesis associated radical SAM protein HpnH